MVVKKPEEKMTIEMEKHLLQEWRKKDMPNKFREWRKGKQTWYLCIGPPYVSGTIHIGHALNGTLKDAICRYHRMDGMDVFARQGYDMHGMPIEHKVEKQLGLRKDKVKEFGEAKFVEECKRFAIEFMGTMSEDFYNLGVDFDYSDPYKTIVPDYIYRSWATFKAAEKKGLLYKGFYPSWVCPRCQTTLSYNEIEYSKRTDMSVYVKFPVVGEEKTFFLIWTTTPWTLPSNTGIAVNPKYDYAKVEVNGETLIIAKELVEKVMGKAGISKYKIFSTVKGRELKGTKYVSPLKDVIAIKEDLSKAYRVITDARNVTLDEGTGLVHIAPGHGEVDYVLGKDNDLPIVCPVGMDGVSTEEQGMFAGKHVFDVNKEVADYLESQSALFASEKVTHDYPHCWRCDGPLLTLSALNWFFKASAMREELLAANEKVVWRPQFAQARFKDWLVNLRDWPISRQRYWGIPIPIWECNGCGKYDVIGSEKEFKEKFDIPKDFDPHIPQIDGFTYGCKECGGEYHRTPDIADVWFDSSVASWVTLPHDKEPDAVEKYWPADMNIEARDQIRGWWNSQLISGLVTYDKAPYKEVLMHGFVMQEAGVKMSKSKGGAGPAEVADKYTRDGLRFYLCGVEPGKDFFYSEEGITDSAKVMRTWWNVYKFAATYMALDAYRPGVHKVEETQIEDKWIMSKLQSLIKVAKEGYDTHNLQDVQRAVRTFLLEDLSRWYVKLIRSRVWHDGKSLSKEAAYRTLYDVLVTTSKLMAPITPFITESMYNALDSSAGSVHLTDFPLYEKAHFDADLESAMDVAREIVEVGLAARAEVKIKLRWPIQEVVVVTDDLFGERVGTDLAPIIASQLNAKEVRVANESDVKLGTDYLSVDFSKGKVLIPKKLSDELFSEAMAREVIRRVQGCRKELKLKENSRVVSEVVATKDFLDLILGHKDLIAKETRSKSLLMSSGEGSVKGLEKPFKVEKYAVKVIVAGA